MGKIRVTYTVIEFVEINVADYEKSTQDLEMFAEDKVFEVVPDNADDWEWEWVKRPKTKFEQLQPPAEVWFDSSIGRVATNGHLVIKEGFVLPEGIKLSAEWKIVEEVNERMENVLSADWSKMPPHYGWFDKGYLPLKELGLTVLGVDYTAYLVKDGELVAILMAANNKGVNAEKYFQFNEGESE
jgi:hypothetical protein